jgi:hypothetical protein
MQFLKRSVAQSVTIADRGPVIVTAVAAVSSNGGASPHRALQGPAAAQLRQRSGLGATQGADGKHTLFDSSVGG